MKILIGAVLSLLALNVNAALLERLGGLAYYDDVADLTWLQDTNYAQTSGYVTDGRMLWDAANNWAAGLTIAGIDGWRLPNKDEADTCSGFNCTDSELGNMYYNVLGNTAGNFISNTGPFSNVAIDWYWTNTETEKGGSSAWYFNMAYGRELTSSKGSNLLAWAVHDGDVSPVPIPAAVWLFGSGLLGLIGLARRR